MSRYSLAPRAQRDIGAIWDYTAKRWDVEQADRYVLELRHIIQMVADDPRKRRACDDIRLGYWKYPANSHMIFFCVTRDGIEIMRVLHQSMDYARHF